MLLSEPVWELKDTDDGHPASCQLSQVQVIEEAKIQFFIDLFMMQYNSMNKDALEDPGEAECELKRDYNPFWLRYVIHYIANNH